MNKWREAIYYYINGVLTPMKMGKQNRRRHLFEQTDNPSSVRSPCGYTVNLSRLSKKSTDVRLCRHCLKAVIKRGAKKKK